MAVGLAYFTTRTLQNLFPPIFESDGQNIKPLYMLFMVACAYSASRYGLVPGIIASAASFIAINYLLTSSFHLVHPTNPADIFNMGIFLFAVLLISLVTSRTHEVAQKAAKRELSTQVLFNLYRIASSASSRKQLLEKLQDHLTRTLQMEVAFFLPPLLNPDAIELAFPPDIKLDENDIHALELCWRDTKTTGQGSFFLGNSVWRFKPLIAQSGMLGVIGVKPSNPVQLDAWMGNMLITIVDQIATLIENIDLATTMEASRINEEREKLRSMLLSSVSHDLKTPLSSIIGALSIYRSQGEKLDVKKRESLIDTALNETERLNSFITNILDMTRLESRKIEFRKEWCNPLDVVEEVIGRLENRSRNHEIIVHPPQQRIEVYMDYMMTGQVLQNIIDNASKYTPSGMPIELYMIAAEGQDFSYRVRDHGKGIPPEKMKEIFDKYARLQKRDSQIAGTGLGLSISKAIMEAQGGSVQVENHPEGGAVFTVNIPTWRLAEAKKYAVA
jgi:two-component system sensor histidine kinase KdpD